MNWTRAHDAHIARECEGLKPIREKGMPEHLWKWNDLGENDIKASGAIWLPNYKIDANARDRAAEAWRKAKVGRWYTTTSEVNDVLGGTMEPGAECCDFNDRYIGDGPNALLWALYAVTGGAV